ncbi:MAG TPA: hypothetical protein VI583_08670 [Cyclobacteriaceae bacterium]|nr:hypothetical protein [Cyclobacteriaceae bacterium]
MNQIDENLLKVSSIILLSGGLIFWFGAFFPPYKQWTTSDLKEYLLIIDSHRINWYIIHASFLLGVILTIFGTHLLSQTLLAAGANRIFANLLFSSYLAGSIFWILNIAFRVTVTTWYAGKFAEQDALFDMFKSMNDWTNLIFSVYMVLAYFAIGCMGMALLGLTMLPRWVDWFCIVMGFFGVFAFILRIPLWAPPLMVHLPFMVTGIFILIKLKH